MRKVSVLGHFAEGKNLLNGQTIKTKILTESLENVYSSDEVIKIDTHGGIKTLVKAPYHPVCQFPDIRRRQALGKMQHIALAPEAFRHLVK